MEPPNENQLGSYFHHHSQSTTASTPTTAAPPSNSFLPPTDGTHMVFSHSVPSVVSSQLEPAKRKRGRPRKYVTPEEALAARKATATASRERKDLAASAGSSSPASFAGSSRKSQLLALGNAGQGFTPHVVTVNQGEDVAQKIMMFMQQSKREICILSASGSISDASLRQPATSGGNMTYEGRYDIITLSGSYIRTEMGGRSGGLSVCLSSTSGQIIGGSVGGPLRAAGPVQVIIGTFVIDAKKDVNAGVKNDASTSMPVGGVSVSNMGFCSPVESSGQNPFSRSDDHQTLEGSHFMRSMHISPSRPGDWTGMDARDTTNYDLTGRAGYHGSGVHHSPQNGDYNQISG